MSQEWEGRRERQQQASPSRRCATYLLPATALANILLLGRLQPDYVR